MSPLVPLLMYGWIPIVLYLFTRYPPQRALIISYIAAVLFLPEAVFAFPVIAAFNKITATAYGTLLATGLYHSERFERFEPHWADLPMLIWCCSTVLSQMANGLSPISPTIVQTATWGIPYLMGRLYLGNLSGLRQLAVGIFVGGLLYAPLCLLEMRISPSLHLKVYGFNVRDDMSQAIRYGGYRPTVFMVHGLWVGMWMMAASLVGIWLWRSGVLKQLWGVSIRWLALGQVVVFILCKSTGAYIYFVVGTVILFAARQLRTGMLLLVLILGLSTYLYMGVNGSLYTVPQVANFMDNATDERSSSLAFRMKNEEILSVKARERLLLGWGASGGNRIRDDEGKDITTTDSYWIIAFGEKGVLGLFSWATTLLLPAGLIWWRCRAQTWATPAIGPVIALAVVLPLYLMDSILNAMFCPVFLLAAGGLTGFAIQAPVPVKKTVQRRRSGVSNSRRLNSNGDQTP